MVGESVIHLDVVRHDRTTARRAQPRDHSRDGREHKDRRRRSVPRPSHDPSIGLATRQDSANNRGEDRRRHTPDADDRMKRDGQPGKDASQDDSPRRAVGLSVHPGRKGSEEEPISDDFRFNSADEPFAAQISQSRESQKNPSRPQRLPTPRHQDADERRPSGRQDEEPDESPDDGRRLERTPSSEPAESLEEDEVRVRGREEQIAAAPIGIPIRLGLAQIVRLVRTGNRIPRERIDRERKKNGNDNEQPHGNTASLWATGDCRRFDRSLAATRRIVPAETIRPGLLLLAGLFGDRFGRRLLGRRLWGLRRFRRGRLGCARPRFLIAEYTFPVLPEFWCRSGPHDRATHSCVSLKIGHAFCVAILCTHAPHCQAHCCKLCPLLYVTSAPNRSEGTSVPLKGGK